ncbi:MAG: hypothetical protein ACXVDH_04025 [Nocardioides sp.]
MSQRRHAVVIADEAREGGRIYGSLFDHVRLETYDALSQVLTTPPVVLALTGSGMDAALGTILARRPAGLAELHLHVDHVTSPMIARRLAEAPGWTVTDLGRAGDGSAVLVVEQVAPGEDAPRTEAALTLSLEALRPQELAPAWPEALKLRPAPRPKQGPAEPAAAPARGALSGWRTILGLTAGAAVLVVVLLVVLAVVGGFEAVVIGLLVGIAMLLLVATAGVAYAVSLLRRASVERGSHAAGLATELTQLRAVSDNLLRRQRKIHEHARRADRTTTALAAKQAGLEEYVAEFAGQFTAAQAAAAERHTD